MRGAMLRLVEVEEVEFELWIDGGLEDTFQSAEQAEEYWEDILRTSFDDECPRNHEVKRVTRIVEQEVLDVAPGDYD